MTVRVDFTPMVDMNMLLITFFMLCTSLSKPQTMEISMPSNDKNVTEEQQSKVKASQAITLLLGGDDKLYYYDGEPNYKDYSSLKETTYKADGLRAMLLQRNRAAVNEVNELKQQKLNLKISEEEFTKKSDITDAWDDKGDIIIGNDVWIGYEAVIPVDMEQQSPGLRLEMEEVARMENIEELHPKQGC